MCSRTVQFQHSRIYHRVLILYQFLNVRCQTKRRELRDRRQDENVERLLPTMTKTPPSNARRNYMLSSPQLSPSCESMAYSLDSQMRPPVAHTHTNDGAGSVVTMATDNQSLLSYVTRSTMAPSRFQEQENENNTHHHHYSSSSSNNSMMKSDEKDDISLSLLETDSFLPSDEELNAIGWAKALDTNSGSYYYFTLDRTKTVWENPLAASP